MFGSPLTNIVPSLEKQGLCNTFHIIYLKFKPTFPKLGGFLKWGYPNSWMVCDGEFPLKIGKPLKAPCGSRLGQAGRRLAAQEGESGPLWRWSLAKFGRYVDFMRFSSSQSVMKKPTVYYIYSFWYYFLRGQYERAGWWCRSYFSFYFATLKIDSTTNQLDVFLKICTWVWLRAIDLSCHILSYMNNRAKHV